MLRFLPALGAWVAFSFAAVAVLWAAGWQVSVFLTRFW